MAGILMSASIFSCLSVSWCYHWHLLQAITLPTLHILSDHNARSDISSIAHHIFISIAWLGNRKFTETLSANFQESARS